MKLSPLQNRCVFHLKTYEDVFMVKEEVFEWIRKKERIGAITPIFSL